MMGFYSQALAVTAAILFSINVLSDEIKFQNETIDGDQAMQVFGFDQGVSQGLGQGTPQFRPFIGRTQYVIQFAGPVQDNWKAELGAAGIEFGGFVPNNAFIAKISSDRAWALLNQVSYVRVVIPYKTSLRISGWLQAPSVFQRAARQRIIVRFTSENDAVAITEQLKNLGLKISGSFSSKDVVAISPVNAISDIADIEGVEWVEPAPQFKNLDFDFFAGQDNADKSVKGDYNDLTGYESGTKLMNFQVAWNKGLHGEGEVVGIVDSGLDRGSITNILDDFKGQVVKGYSKGGFLSKGWNDTVGHGTHTAGSILGLGVSSRGILRGGAYGARLVEEGMGGPLSMGLSIGFNLEDLFVSVHKNDGVNVHSDSWGSNRAAVYDSVASTVDSVMWKNPDLLLVFAAGNSGADLDKDGHIDPGSVESPATAKNCLSVGASKNLVLKGGIQKRMIEAKEGPKLWGAEPLSSSRLSENPNGMAPFSSIGPTRDGRIKPDVVAPGTNIISARSQDPKATPLWGPYNKYYVYSGGTSMATPLVAGAAAVTHQYLKNVLGKNPSAALVKAVLIHTAHDLYPGQFGLGPQAEFATTRPNINEGYGRVDMANVVDTHYAFVDERSGVSTGSTWRYNGLQNVPMGAKIRVTMAYTDAPGTASAAAALVNDLDLSVIDPNGGIHYPNHLAGPDHLNNIEMVEFDAPVTGSYIILVKGTNIPVSAQAGGQPFALVWDKL